MPAPTSPFEDGLRLMGAQQQLVTRSLVNMIEMISASSHRYAHETGNFTREAMSLVQKAATARDPQSLTEIQNEWAKTCLKYGENQAHATMQFVEQCGLQALNIVATPEDDTDKDRK